METIKAIHSKAGMFRGELFLMLRPELRASVGYI